MAASTQLAGSVSSQSAAVAFPLAAFGIFGSFIAFYRNADAATASATATAADAVAAAAAVAPAI